MNKASTNLLLITDADNDIGYGHYRRCLSLTDALTKQAFNPKIVHFKTRSIAKVEQFSEHQLAATALVIIDTPLATEQLIASIKSVNIPIICLDVFTHQSVDLTIATFQHDANQHADLVGLDYCILRDEILRSTIKEPNGAPKRVLISIGGADVNHESFSLVDKLKANGLKITIILGPLNHQLNQQSVKYAHDESINIFHQPANFVQLLNDHDFVITNAGTSMFEAMYLAKAIHVMPQTAQELNVAEFALAHGAILGIGAEQFTVPSKQQIITASNKAKQLIDGKGIERITAMVVKLAS